jgi:hypothetical protein
MRTFGQNDPGGPLLSPHATSKAAPVTHMKEIGGGVLCEAHPYPASPPPVATPLLPLSEVQW